MKMTLLYCIVDGSLTEEKVCLHVTAGNVRYKSVSKKALISL